MVDIVIFGMKKHSKLTTHKHYRNLNQVHQNSTVSDIHSIVLRKIPEAYPIITPSEIPNMISTWNVSKTQEKEAFHKTRACVLQGVKSMLKSFKMKAVVYIKG